MDFCLRHGNNDTHFHDWQDFFTNKNDKTCQPMKKLGLLGLVLLLSLTGCEFIGDVFGAGVYLGVFMSVIVVVIIVIFVAKIFKK
jgi:hypothetical protein